MPKIDGNDMEQHALTGNFGFSATRMKKLEDAASEFTLATLVVDKSGSVNNFRVAIEIGIQEIIKSCRKSPRADNLLVRLVAFNDGIEEIHGYKLLADCNLDDYEGCLRCSYTTALYDATETAVRATTSFAKTLGDRDIDVNAVVIVVTDGLDNASSFGQSDVKKAFNDSIQEEHLESMLSILIGVNTSVHPSVSPALNAFRDATGFTQYEVLENADESSLSKMANFVSQSFSAQSQSLGKGVAANPGSLSI